ncbi:L-rhamnose mutarotase [Massilia sp. TSP1-1-2]|uniref:L-rhamnose mutarotase n=1 Tax=unclassified Massilia TaxID=2609279 RepID=UPI003CF4FB5D
MQLKAGAADEYRRRHEALWSDLAAALTDAGIYDYSIFLDDATHCLFAVLRLREGDTSATLASSPVMRRWWDYMADLMETEPGNRPREWPLTPMFHLP